MRRTLAALRRSPLAALRRSPLAALLVLVAIAACSGIITGPDAGPDTRPRSIRVTPTALDLTLGQTATLTARLYDVTGTETVPEPGRRITFVSADEAIATVTPDGVIVPVADGTVLVRAEYGMLGLGVPVRVLARPRLVIVDGDGQTAEQRDSLPRRLVVRALDATGQPVVDVPVTFSVTTGGGTVSPADMRTDVTGAAQALWTLGLPLGAQTAHASADGYDPVDFSATATAGTRPVRIGLNSARSTLIGAGDTVTIVGVAYNVADDVLGAAPITWSSSLPAVATVDQAGVVTAVAPGATFIRAESGAARDSLRIEVLALPVIAVAPATLAFTSEAGLSPAAAAVAVTNTGGGVLSGLAASVAYGAGATGWLSVAFDATTAPAELSVTPATTALAAGAYTATITIVSSVAGVAPVDMVVSLTVAASVLPKLELGADLAHPAGLMAASTVTVPATAAADVSVTLRTLDATAALVSADADVEGAVNGVVQLAAGSTAATWFLHGVEGASGRAVPIVAEAAGYRPDTLVVSIERPLVLLGQRGDNTLPATGGEDPVLDVTVGGLVSGGFFSPMRVRPGGIAPAFTLSSNTAGTALLRHVATPFTLGADQGPAASITFSLAPGRQATSIGDLPGVPASIRLARTGTAGLASVSLVSQPAEYTVAGTGSVTFTLTGTAALPRVVIVSGNAQAVAWDEIVPDSLVVRLLDGNNAPVSGVTVDFTVSANGGTLSPASAVTDANGLAATQWRMSTALGAHTVTAGAAGFGSVTFDGTSLGGTVVTRVAITAARTTLSGGPGDRETYTATAFNLADSIITSKPIAWTSSAPSIVSVDSAGNVLALAVGQATIRATVDLGIAEVLVTVPANTWVTLGARAYTAAGLMREVVETFAAPAPVAYFLTLRSADPTRALVSASSSDVGTTSTTFLVAAGTSSIRWWLHGLEGLGGDTVSVTAESNGFTVDTTLVTVVPPRMRIGVAGDLVLPASGGRDPWFAVTIGGEVEPAGASLAYVALPVRAGAPAPQFVLSSSDPAVAELRFRPTPNTTGVAQGPGAAVTFGIAAGFSGTFFPGYDSGELPSLEMSRPGGAGTATIELAGPAGYLLDGIEPQVTTAPVGPPTISLALVGTPLLGVNGSATVRATLAQPAPVGGVAVTLVSGDLGRATVDAPSTVTVAAGATTADYVIRGVTPGSVTLTASASGYADGTLSVGVSVLAISVPLDLNVPFTQTTSLPITLPQAAPVGGTTVTVTSADPSTVLVLTPTVVIPAGAVSGNAQLQGLRLGVAVVSAAVPNAVTGTTNVRVTAVLDIVESTVSMNTGFSVAIFTTRLLSNGAPFAAPAGGIPLTFIARNPACVVAPSGATIAAGQNSIVSVADYGGTAPLDCTTFVVVTSPQFDPDSVQITVRPQPTSTMSVNASVGAGLSAQSSLTLGVAAPAGGTTVTITSSDPTRLVLSPNVTTVGTASVVLTIPSGSTSVPFWLSGLESQSGTSTISAVVPGYVAPAPSVATVNPIGIELFGNTSLSTLSGDGSGSVYVGELDPPGPTQTVRREAVIRAGGQALTITLTSSAPGVLLPVVGGVAASPQVVTIAPGASRATYGIRPLTSGTGVITAASTGAGSPTRANYPALIAVTQPTSTLSLTPTLAAGLSRQGFFSLGNPAPAGGVTVTISSSDASRLVVAANAVTVGTGSADIFVPAGFTQATFWYSAIEGQEGTTAQITAAIAGGLFAPPTPVTVTVNPIGIELFGNTSLTTLGGDGTGSVYVGELDPAGPSQSVRSEAVIRAGGQPLTITLTSSAPGVLLPVVGGVAASPGLVTIAVGSSRATYGIRPLSAGIGVITAVSAGAGSPARAGYPAPITVTQPTSTIALNPALAAGLSRQGFFSLGNPAPAGGVTVTISSSDASRLVVAANGTTVGTGSADIVVPAGFTQATFWFSAIEGQGGTTAQVSAVVQGGQFANPAPATVNIGVLGLEAFGTTTLTTLGQDGSGTVYLGTLGAAGPSQSVSSEAVIRAGGQSVTVTLTSSAPSVVAPVVAGVAASPRTVTIVPGESRASYGIRPITAGTTTIGATATNAEAPVRTGYPAVITVTSPTTSLVTTPRVGAGLAASNGSVTLQVGAPAGGVTVRLTSSDPTRLLLAPNLLTAGAASIDLFIPQGSSFASFVQMGLEDVTGSPTVTAQTPGYTDATATVSVEPIGVQWSGATSLSTLGGDGSGTVHVGVASGTAGNRTITPEQVIRFGGVARTITISSSDPSVVLPVFGGVAQQDLTVTILPGQSRAVVDVRPVGAGTATISPTGAGLLPAQTGSIPQAVTVTVPAQSLAATFVQGSGLAQSATLSLASPVPTGGRTLTLTSSDPTRLLVAPDATTGGAGEITIALAQGFSNRSFVLMAPEGVTGSVTLLASIPGYRDTTFTFTVAQPAVTLNGPTGSRTIAQGDEAFQATVGVPSGDNVTVQFVRFGAPAALEVTLTSSVPAVGTLVVGGVAGSPQTVQIAPGQSASPSLAGATANFRPLSAGNTTITATIPGYLQQNNAIRTVVVSP